MSNPYLSDFSGDDELGDEYGGEDLLGYGETMSGDDELAGRLNLLARGRQLQKAALRRGMRLPAGARRAPSQAQRVEALRGDDIYFGVDSGATLVGIGASATITTSPQKRNIPKKLFLTAAVATAFLVNDIRVGVDPVLATTGAISAAIFIQDSTAAVFRAVICEVGMDFSVTVTNISGATARFTATVLGTWVPASIG